MERDFHPGDERTLILVENLSRSQIVQYAGVSGDFNPIHTDEIFVTQAAGYPTVFAHGMLTMGMSARIFTDWFGAGHLIDLGARFVGQVWPGDTLTARGTITEVRHSPDGLVVDARVVTINQDGVEVQTAAASTRVS